MPINEAEHTPLADKGFADKGHLKPPQRLRGLWPFSGPSKLKVTLIMATGLCGLMLASFYQFAPVLPGGLELLGRIEAYRHETADRWSQKLGLHVQQIYVENHHFTPKSAILEALEAPAGTPMYRLELAAAKEKLENLGWVEKARVQRIWLPGQLHISIQERQPLALWQHKGQYYLIDESGEVIIKDPDARFAALPLVAGPGAEQAAATLIAHLETNPAVFTRMTAASRVGNRRWDLYLDDRLTVKLPAQGTHQAFERLHNLLSDQQLDLTQLAIIDLRLPDRIILRPHPALQHG